MPEIYLVGGYVRDELLGRKSKDLDYAFVLSEGERDSLGISNLPLMEAAYEFMKLYLIGLGVDIKVETPEELTIRGVMNGVGADYVLSRRETGEYYEGTRKPICTLGSFEDDIWRRDFTINALAKRLGGDGEVIDLTGGLWDLEKRVLDTPLDPMKTFTQDALRVLRAWRFMTQVGFRLEDRVLEAIWVNKEELVEKTIETVSEDRIRQEFLKGMYVNSWLGMKNLMTFPEELVQVWFPTSPQRLWFMPTFREKMGGLKEQ